jgi:hypothetical protein
MSVFKVQLTNVNQGLLDTNGQSTGTSIQRGVYVMGPNKVNRLLIDGSTFTDSNYWKRYAYPQVPYDQALVSTVTDDGSVWGDNPASARTFPVNSVFTAIGSSYAVSQQIDYLSTYGSRAIYVQITVTGTTTCRINGSVEITLTSTNIQVFNPGTFDINKLEFKGSATPTVTVVASVVSVQNT